MVREIKILPLELEVELVELDDEELEEDCALTIVEIDRLSRVNKVRMGSLRFNIIVFSLMLLKLQVHFFRFKNHYQVKRISCESKERKTEL